MQLIQSVDLIETFYTFANACLWTSWFQRAGSQFILTVLMLGAAVAVVIISLLSLLSVSMPVFGRPTNEPFIFNFSLSADFGHVHHHTTKKNKEEEERNAPNFRFFAKVNHSRKDIHLDWSDDEDHTPFFALMSNARRKVCECKHEWRVIFRGLFNFRKKQQRTYTTPHLPCNIFRSASLKLSQKNTNMWMDFPLFHS